MIIQTYQPENFSIQCAREQNYEKFYETEIELRKQLKHPPFCDIIVVHFNSLKEKQIQNVSGWVYQYLKEHLDQEQFHLFGPLPSPIAKIQNRIRYRIIIKGNLDEKANKILNDCMKEIYARNQKDTKVAIDVNPNNMM